MKTHVAQAWRNPATRFMSVAVAAVLTALVILPGIAAGGDFEEGTVADVLFVIQVVVVVIALAATTLAIRARRRTRAIG